MKPGTLIIVGLILLTLLGAAAIYLTRGWESKRAFERAWQRAIAAGVPASVQDLTVQDVPDSENAAIGYLSAAALLDERRGSPDYLFTRRLMATIEGDEQSEGLSADEIADLLAESGDSLDAVVAASRLPHCVWDRNIFDVESHYDIQLPWVMPTRLHAHLLCLRALEEAERGELADASETILAVLRIADHLAEPAFLITLSVRAAMQQTALRAVERVFQYSGVPAQGLIDAIAAINPRDRADEAIRIEGLLAIVSREWIDEMIVRHPARASAPTGLLPRRWDEWRDRAHIVELTMHNAAQITQPPAQRSGSLRDGSEDWSSLAHHLYPAVTSFDRHLTRVETRRRLALAAIGLRLHHMENGDYPDDVEMPTDPESGRAMQYERLPRGFRLWSDSHPGGSVIEWVWE